jgi:hypothetical protein
MQSLSKIAYGTFANKYGTFLYNIKENKKYNLLDMDGVTLIPLGRCLNKTINIKGYAYDPTVEITLTFEFEMDNPLLQTVYYDQNQSQKVNIFIDEENEK